MLPRSLLAVMLCSLSVLGFATNTVSVKHTGDTINLGKHSFQEIHLTGPILATISNNPKASVILSGSTNSLAAVTENITASTLSINNPSATPITVAFSGNHLHELIANDSTVVAKKLTLPQALSIRATGNANLKLQGLFNIHELTANNNSVIKIEWLNSPELTITATDHSQITVNGRSEKNIISLSQNSRLNADGLTANNVLVQTKDNAVVSVNAPETLRAFAENNSNIYYAKTPTHFTRVSKDSANILQLN